MHKDELALAGKLLGLAGVEFSNHSCNDLEIANTEEHRKMVMEMWLWKVGGDVGAIDYNDKVLEMASLADSSAKTICVNDSFLMLWMGSKLKWGSRGIR